MSVITSQITSLAIVYSIAYSGADKKKSKLRVTGLCAGNSPGTGEFPAQRSSHAEMFPFDDVIMRGIHSQQHILIPDNSSYFIASYCDDTMTTCYHVFLWTNNVEVSVLNLWCLSSIIIETICGHVYCLVSDVTILHLVVELFIVHYGTLGDRKVYTSLGLICLLTFLLISNTGFLRSRESYGKW